MKRKDLKREIKSNFKSFAEDYEFWFYKQGTLLRERESTLHIIHFNPGDSGFACIIAIQPLYAPSDVMSFSFGNEITRFKANHRARWPYEDAEAGFHLMKNLLIENGLTWFDTAGSPKGMIQFISEVLPNDPDLCFGFDPFLQNIYLGFSYLYLGQLTKADKKLQKASDLMKDDDRGWVVENKIMIASIRELARDEPNSVYEKLQEFIKYTRTNLKLEQQPNA